ncbi:hypothetical protein D9613_007560 [Agrocybe pediades]|uniref:Uncharacterized protein n=1 Tax=Agrocybe pediades TaxID=84607 RepID=A0A8H4QLT0_9AGAR|nr:hypothetical protein D9613_007560 [Agrocybe pediades]
MFSDNEDQDSLFGSPPPSPRRPASPSLALPSAGLNGGRSSTSTAPSQNVGTIALPGSQPNSELPINPLALSLNHGIVQRPPAASNAFASTSSATWHLHVPRSAASITAEGPITSRPPVPPVTQPAPTTTTTPAVKKPKKKKKKTSPAEPAQERVGPEFELPDPSGPPPSHWLRNQQNLLGKAGVVARVKPSTLVHRPGATQANPILIDDEDDSPPLSRQQTPFQDIVQPLIDPSLLAKPSIQEIVAVLINQKDIFPVLEGVLKLVLRIASKGPQLPPPTGFERRPPGSAPPKPAPPPSKKRKLDRVPAGAADWDVPYPFPQGEGPDAYQQNWDRERGKQLIAQLIKLIKIAARKAATKKYLQQQKEKQLEEEERERTTEYYQRALARAQAQIAAASSNQVLQDSSNSIHTPIPNNIPDSSSSSVSSKCENTFPASTSTQAQLINPFPHPQPSQTTPSSNAESSFSPPDVSSQSNTAPSTRNGDSATLDSWMNFLVNNFPTAFDGSSDQSFNLYGTPTEPRSQGSTPGPDDLAYANIFGTNAGDGNTASNQADLAAMLSMFSQPQPLPGMDMNDAGTSSSSTDNSMMDPNLWMFNYDAADVANWGNMNVNVNADAPSARQASPMASSSSTVSGNGPETPVSAEWEMSAPEVFGGGGGGGNDGRTGQGWEGENGMDTDPQDFGPLPEALVQEDAPILDKGKGKAVDSVEPSTTPIPTHTTTTTVLTMTTTNIPKTPLFPPLFTAPSTQPEPTEPCASSRDILQRVAGTSVERGTPVPVVAAGVERKARKVAVLKRAREKRDRLQSELNDVKMKLWESTIEQAGLLQLLKQVEVASVTSASSTISE